MRSDEYSNLGDFDFVFEINLGYESCDQVDSFGEKNRSPKSRDKYTCKMMHVVSNISINDWYILLEMEKKENPPIYSISRTYE